jgi:hypothetical protein
MITDQMIDAYYEPRKIEFEPDNVTITYDEVTYDIWYDQYRVINHIEVDGETVSIDEDYVLDYLQNEVWSLP